MFSPISAKTFCEPTRVACGSRSRRRGSSRRGISLFEVLISILVAAIGVFGVLVLIPFAVRNAQKGIDREAGINAAKNFIADFQAYGYQNPLTWYDDVADVQVPTPLAPSVAQPPAAATGNNIEAGWPYIIDPIGAATNASSGNPYGQFPTVTGLPDDVPRLNITNVFEPGSIIPSGIALARRMSMQPDDLNFDEPATELAGPRQVYYELGNEKFAKRQYNARYLTFSIVVPDDDAGQQYRMYTIVGTDGDRGVERVFEVIDPAAASGAANTMRLAKTDNGAAGVREYEQMGLGGGDVLLSEIATSGQPALTEDQIRNNDWMMLISYQRLGAVEPTHDDIQISFYRVIHSDRVSPVAGSAPGTPGDGITGRGPAERTFHVTLQGPDVDLYRDWAAKMVGNRTDVPTYAVLIPNVLAVYERTFRTEPDSSWQAQ